MHFVENTSFRMYFIAQIILFDIIILYPPRKAPGRHVAGRGRNSAAAVKKRKRGVIK